MDAPTDFVHLAQAEVFKAVGHPIRLQIVKLLAHGERSVSDIVMAVSAEQSNVSRHLALLKQSGVLVSRRSGLKIYYRLSSPQFAECLETVLRQIADAVQASGLVRMGLSGDARQTLPASENI